MASQLVFCSLSLVKQVESTLPLKQGLLDDDSKGNFLSQNFFLDCEMVRVVISWTRGARNTHFVQL